ALLRGLISAASAAMARASDQSDAAEDVLSDAEAAIFALSEKRIGRGFLGIQEIVRESFGSVDALLQRGQRITGLATHYTDLDDTPGISLSEMRAKARRLKQAQGGRLDLIIVDYLQLMSGGGKRFENRTQEVSAISRGLKALAKELSVPVIALSQLSRAPESR